MRKRESSHRLLKKVGNLIEEQPEPASQAQPEIPEEAKQPPANRNRALMTYIAFLFGVAFVLVLLSFLIQQKDISELNKNASSALSRAEQLQDDNRELSEANLTLQERTGELEDLLEERNAALQSAQEDLKQQQEANAELEKQLEGAQPGGKVSQAYELLLTAQRALDEAQTDAFQSAMTALAPLSEFLDEQGKRIYSELLARMPGQE